MTLKHVPALLASSRISPFLPKTNIQFSYDSTSLSWLKTCPRLYEYSMLEGWRSRGEHVHLKFGQLYHSALELYDKLRATGETDPRDQVDGLLWTPDHDNVLRKVVQWILVNTWEPDIVDTVSGAVLTPAHPWSPDHPFKNRETLIRSIIWYLDHFKDDPAATLILANGKPAVELSFRMELDWGPRVSMTDEGWTKRPHESAVWELGSQSQPYLLCGHLDRVVEFGGQKYVADRKTTGSSPTPYYFDGFAPDNQMSIYTLAARVQFSTPVAGVIIDAAQIAVGFTRFQRGFTYRTEAQLEEWLSDFRFWTAQAEGFAERGHWPMNDRSCGMYGGCTFRKVCSKSPEVRAKFLESDFERRPWNPLESR